MSGRNPKGPLYTLSRLAAIAIVTSAAGCGGENGFGVGIPAGAVGSGNVGGAVLKGEQGVAGIRIVLIGRDSTTTDFNGEYIFPSLAPTFYTLAIRLPPGENLEPGQSTVRNANVGSGKTARVEWRLGSGIAGTP